MSPRLDDTPLRHVVLMMELRTLHQAVTAKLARWKNNGFMTRQENEIWDAALFRELDKQIIKPTNSGIDVQPWLVSKAEKMEAFQLAKVLIYEVGLRVSLPGSHQPLNSWLYAKVYLGVNCRPLMIVAATCRDDIGRVCALCTMWVFHASMAWISFSDQFRVLPER